MLSLLRLPSLIVIGLALAACAVAPITAPASTPSPLQAINVVVPGAARIIAPEDAGFSDYSTQFLTGVAGITAQARTLFSPARFADEIAPLPHVLFRFNAETTFTGQGISWQASELVLAAPGNEIMLLARATGVDDWSVYVPGDPAPLQTLLSTLTQQ